ncbi:response regulator transcription factor [Roseinatronobacter monicus]|uniref:Two-component system OmpR family response regulator/two-component system response regulator TctD n=1 Tax=Roseinatronobacter monicus TaxID=393481 RepID=A0A543KIH5_9RHOB|nr:response regulator transcription factor [Roseinatronobacter monicus]TQM94886.1 two-component system OmpR family response regulator/two-component system response regulator TctD [Roseinatronobacter monicus]
MRIVLIEDNTILARALIQALQDAGHAVDWLDDGQDADDFLAQTGADLVILDVNLPTLGGLDILRRLRARGDSYPVLMLTAQGQVQDRVVGLDAGADDYLVKPFEIVELHARLRALARRPSEARRDTETIGAVCFDRAARSVSGHDGIIGLSRRELSLFEAFADNPGRVLSKEQLGERIYGVGADIDANAVELLVSRLRRKLDGHGLTIRTLRGLGYLVQIEDA